MSVHTTWDSYKKYACTLGVGKSLLVVSRHPDKICNNGVALLFYQVAGSKFYHNCELTGKHVTIKMKNLLNSKNYVKDLTKEKRTG